MVEKEKEQLSSDVERFNRWSETHGISAIFFDLDGTLFDTDTYFRSRAGKALNLIMSLAPEVPKKRLEEDFSWLNKEAYFKRSVNPDRWEYLVKEISRRHSLDMNNLEEPLSMLMDLYDASPPLHPRVNELLEVTLGSSSRVASLTHANRRWTDIKLGAYNIRRFFERVFIVDEDSYKDTEAWGTAIYQFGVKPENVLVFEDNVEGGILASYQAGVRKHVWIDLHNGWSLYQEGRDSLPEGTIVVNQPAEFLDRLRAGEL